MSKLPMPFNNPDADWDREPPHSGVDFGQPYGKPILASGDGYVVNHHNPGGACGYGIWIYYYAIDDEIGYCHMPSHAACPPPGTPVSYGTQIGVVGSTGNSSGPHAHAESLQNPTPQGFFDRFDINSWVGDGDGGGGELAPNQRRTNDYVNRRAQPTTASENLGNGLAPGEVGNFDGWIRGESVEGNNVWFRGVSGNWFWSGGFEGGADGSGLSDLNTGEMEPYQRRATAGGTRGRSTPSTSGEQVAFLDEGEIGDFNGWRYGESVDGKNIWLRGSHSGGWFWLGGLTPESTASLEDLNDGPVPEPDPGDGRIIYPQPESPTDPEAARWAHASKCDPRDMSQGGVQLLIVHGWGVFPNDAEAEWKYFTGWQGKDKGSSPTWQINDNGSFFEVVPPDFYRPWTTGRLDHRAVTVEIQPSSDEPNWEYSDAAYEAVARRLVFSHRRYGVPLQVAVVTGTPEDSMIEVAGITQHNQTPAGRKSKTTCPGPSMDLERIVARAREIIAPLPPADVVEVPRASLVALRATIDDLLGGAQ